ncbi:MAG: peptide chain release factor N(5)-glutamine methyltransferase [Burkholderiaceae bacterium]
MDCVRYLLAANDLPRSEAQMLLRHVLQAPRVWLIAHDTDPLPSRAVTDYRRLLERRLAGEPMAYLVGYREFMSHRFVVTPAVLIPRPETELLVETAVQHLQSLDAPRVLDLGTGSGAVAISIALARPDAIMVATDISQQALDVARQNAADLSIRVEFFFGNWYDSLLDQPGFDLIVSNPPYIAANDPHLAQGDLRFEPECALTDGADGLDALRVIVEGASARLNPGGVLWVEHGWDQAQAVRNLLRQACFRQVTSLPDLAGIERISGGYL